MRYLDLYKEKINCNKEKEVFDYFIKNLNGSILDWEYFVNWQKVFDNIRDLEIDLNIMNYLIGKEDIENEFNYLLKRYPQILRLIPVLLACREKNFQIIEHINENFNQENYSFLNEKELSEEKILKATKFAKNAGLLKLFKNKAIKNVVDYALGIEVGLDSNGRKNRVGTAMEKIVELYIDDICNLL